MTSVRKADLALFFKHLSEAFEIGEVTTYSKSRTGMTNTTYFFRTSNGSSYAVRVSGEIQNERLENELAVRQQLRALESIATNQYIKTAKNAYVYTSGGLSSVVSLKLPGTHPPYPVSPEGCRRIGHALALFHSAVKAIPFTNAYPVLLTSLAKSTARPEMVPEGKRRSTVRKLLAFEKRIPMEELPRGILHGDFHAHNLLFDGGITNIFDMESVSTGPLLLDIARSMADVCNDNEDSFAKISVFLEGYEEIRPLLPIELRTLYAAIAYTSGLVACRLFKHEHFDFGQTFINMGLMAGEKEVVHFRKGD